MQQKIVRIKKNLGALRDFYSKNSKWHEFNSNIDIDTLNQQIMETLSPKSILLLGPSHLKEKYIAYCNEEYGNNFRIVESTKL